MRKVLLSGGAVALALFSVVQAASATDAKPGAMPDLVGPWLNDNAFKLIPMPSGLKPVGDLEGYVQHMTGVDANGKEFNTNAFIGDYKSRLLKPWGAAILKKEAEDAIKGKDPFWPATSCYPFGPTALLQTGPVVLLQEAHKVTIHYERDHQVRHVYLNVPHSRNLRSSWYGESIGHYEGGDTLVVDTIGFNDKTFIDRYGVPFSEQLHIIERYRASGDGQAMRVEVTYDDPKAYTAPWKALIKYHRGRAMPEEAACAESTVDPVTGELYPIPISRKPDF